MERSIRNLVGPILRRIRTEKRLSQAELAAKCQIQGWDISRDIVASIEDQSRAVIEAEIVMLAIVLEVEPASLLPSKKSVISAASPVDLSKFHTKKRRGWFGL